MGSPLRRFLVADEDRSKFEALRAELWKQFQPEEGLESVLVDLLVGYAWRLRRASVIEANIFADRLYIDYSVATFLPPLTRYEALLLNGFHAPFSNCSCSKSADGLRKNRTTYWTSSRRRMIGRPRSRR